MATTLLNCQIVLSKDIGDYFAGTTTSATNAVTIVDTGLIAYPNDWITDFSWALLTSGSYSGQERKISTASLVTTGSLTCGTFGGSVASGVTYEVHRLFSPAEKQRALIQGAKDIFGDCYDLVWNESIVSGNWLKDGSFETWNAGGTALTNWTANAIVASQSSASNTFKHGSYSMLLTGTLGSVSQSISNYEDLKYLAGKTVMWSVQSRCNTASCLRLSVNDGTATTYSAYHTGGTSFTANNLPMYVQATIDYNPTNISFGIHHQIAGGTSFVDDGRVISGYRDRLYIGNLGLAQNLPNEILIEPSDYSQEEPWLQLHDWEVDEDGYLHLPSSVPNDYTLRIIGKQYLDFLVNGTSSTAGTATINLNDPQTQILSAQTAVNLYKGMSMPNFESGTRKDYQGMIGYWEAKVRERKGRFGMPSLPVTISWGHE